MSRFKLFRAFLRKARYGLCIGPEARSEGLILALGGTYGTAGAHDDALQKGGIRSDRPPVGNKV